MIISHKKMPGHTNAPGKFEGTNKCDMYQRHGVGARSFLTATSNAVQKSFAMRAMSEQHRLTTSTDG
jgi:hypothetical protein